MPKKKTIGFVGLGRMGLPMVMNLQKAGFNLIVHDCVPSSMQPFPDLQKASSLEQVAKHSDLILTMLPNDQIVQSVYKSLIHAGIQGKQLIDCSTVGPDTSKSCNKTIQSHDAKYLEAPVSGGVKGAQTATLTFLVGGDLGTLTANTDVLQAMGKRIIHTGDVGNGAAAKLCNNLILGISMVGLSEAMNLAGRLGLPPEAFSEIVNCSTGKSWASEHNCPVPGLMPAAPASRDYANGFASELMLKDLLLATNAADRCGVVLPVGRVVSSLYRNMVEQEQGHAAKDFSVIFKYLQSLQS